MTEGGKKRKNIFDRFSKNLIFLKTKGIIDVVLKYDKTYICPICLDQFSEKTLDQSIENPLSLEDAPPKSLGGKANILTCKKCNNTCGHEIDRHLTERMQELDYHKFLPNIEFTAKFEINENTIQGKISIDENGTMSAYHMDKNNHPIKLQDYIKTATKDTIIDLQIDKKQVNPINLQIALLKTGYLLAFEKYGYSLILDKSYDRIREQLKNPLEIIYPLDFWFQAPFPKDTYGVPFITEKGLESICSIFPLKTRASERVFGIIIPLTSKPIEEVISELKKRFKVQKRFPVKFDSMDGGVNYLTDLEAIVKMKTWINNLK
jgi:transcription elongation factor Elf1